jgi:hypothetical protein
MSSRRPPNDEDERRLRASLVSMKQNSEWGRFRRRERIRWILTLAVVGLLVWKVPWAQWTDRVLEAFHVEVTSVDAGAPD